MAMFKGVGHAASMFAKQPDLEADIVIWFRSNLPVAGCGLPPPSGDPAAHGTSFSLCDGVVGSAHAEPRQQC